MPIQDFIYYCAGVAVGRWDIRLALDSTLIKLRLEPFSEVSAMTPGSLLHLTNFPPPVAKVATQGWLRARPDANTLPPKGTVQRPTIPDSEYLIAVKWDAKAKSPNN